jgi:mannose-6-phosphate isomerase
MFILEPIVHETVWGGKKLTPYTDSSCQKIGHLYAAIDNKSMTNKIIAGSYEGKTLHDWFIDHREAYGLEKYDEVPVLMALVEAADNLSIQVHPNDEVAKSLEGKNFGKNESFFLLEAPKTGFMYNGCKAGSVEKMRELVEQGRTMEGVGTVSVKPGDYVYVTGGTLHAATAGSLSFEIEENCDATYRFYDFDRIDKNGKKRPLQIEKALKSLRPEQKSTVKQYTPNSIIEERMYWTSYRPCAGVIENKTKMFIFATVLRGVAYIMGRRLLPGTAVVLEPGDKFDADGADFMLASPKNK